MKIFRFVGLAVVAILMSVSFAACDDDDDESSSSASIVGEWEDVEDPLYTATFTSSAFAFYENEKLDYRGKYSITGNKISLTISEFPGGEDFVGKTKTYDIYELSEKYLKFGDDGADDPDFNFKRVN